MMKIAAILLLIGSATASYPFAQVAQRYEEQSPVEQTVSYAPQSYRFSYNTGSQGASDVAHHFREESRDESGYVVGKYGYVDPYGKLRVVNYRAGPEGYTVSGDTGADEEGLRQQRELYANDRSYQIQQQVWQALAAGQPIEGILTSAAQNGASASSSSAAAAAAASSANSGSEWTSVSGGHQHQSAGYNVKGQNRFVERYTAAGGQSVKSPAAQLREGSSSTSAYKSSSSSSSSSAASSSAASSAYTAPAVTQTVYSTKTAPIRAAQIKTATYVQPAVTQTVYHSTKSAPVKTAAYKQTTYHTYTAPAAVQTTYQVVKPARYESEKTVQQQQVFTSGYQSPSARLVALNSHKSSSSSASAAASASASASASSGAYTAGGVKGYSGAIKSAPLRVAPVKVARYAVAPGAGQTVVKFSQGGPVPYSYSYNFK